MWARLLFALVTTPVSPDSGVYGTVLDAMTLLPIQGADVSGGGAGVSTDEAGHFGLRQEPGALVLTIRRSGYLELSQQVVLAPREMRALYIRLTPESLRMPPIEVTYEEVRPELIRQRRFDVPEVFQLEHAGEIFRGRYRVCIHSSGEIAAVVPIAPAGAADSLVQKGIRNGWQYKPRGRPACFSWNIELRIRASWKDQEQRRALLPHDR